MPTYVLLSTDALPQDAAARLSSVYPNHRQIDDKAWAIRTQDLSKQISEAVFAYQTPKEAPRHAVFRIDAWWGVHDPALWEWLSVKEPTVDA